MSVVGIIILNYNSTRLTKKCVRSLFAQKHLSDTYHVLVYDNDSKIPPKKEDFSGCEIVHSSKNFGFAQGNNEAVRSLLKKMKSVSTELDYLLFINNDTRVGKNMVRQLIQRFEQNTEIGMVLPKIYFEKDHEYFLDDYDGHQKGKVLWYAGGTIDWDNGIVIHKGIDEVDRGQFSSSQGQGEVEDFGTGCCFLTTPKIWKQLKGFDANYFLYYEDVDLSLRLQRKLKKKIVVEQSAILYHLNAGSSDGSGSSIHQYYQTRSRLRFGLEHAGIRTRLALLREARRIYLTGNPARRLAILDALGGRWGNQTKRIPVEKP